MAEAPPPAFAVGDQIGPYTLEAELGQGGMGQVFRARDSRLGRVVAIKVIRPEFAADEDFRRRFHREARTISTLSNPHVCALYDITEHEGRPCLVMEYVEGETLGTVLARRSLSGDEVFSLATAIASALSAAHQQGIVHRDLKPGNIMVTPFGAKVLDFGLAKAAAVDPAAETTLTEALTASGHVVGTLSYMSPEQVAARPIGPASDVFAAGIIFYEMASGRHPFRGETGVQTMAAILQSPPAPLSGRRDAVSPELIQVIDRCLNKSPTDRFASGSELLQALSASRPSQASTSMAWWVAASCAGVLVAAAAYAGWTRYQQASRTAWVENVAVPEIARLIESDRGLAALRLFKEAERYAPASPALIKVSEGVAGRPVRFESSPEGASLYISDYSVAAGDDLGEWDPIGTSPLTVAQLPRWGYYRVRAVKPGYVTTDSVTGGADTVSITLPPAADEQPGMVWIPPMAAPSAAGLALPGYWLGRYEVTNAEFKRFVDAGGYQDRQYWKEPFVKDGRTVSWAEAAAGFRDATGRPGPSAWELGAFPAGADRMPVTGVSWYEAAAYAAFVGQSLPTLHEWVRAAGISVNANILLLSNFDARGTSAAGSRRGMSPFGSYDMAGNVKEWTATGIGADRYVLGGGWDEAPYEFSSRAARSPWSREANIGLRTITRISPPPDAVFDPVARVEHAMPARASDAEYRVFESLHRYESTPLDSRIERVDDTVSFRRRETASFRAAYGNERVLAHVFLPTNATPPFRTVMVIGGSTIVGVIRRVDDFEYPYEFLVKSGIAVVIPVLTGTLERGPGPTGLSPSQERDRALRWSSDVGRTLEYLDTRSDIDGGRLGLYGISMGGNHAVRLLAVYPRFRAGVLLSGGIYMTQLPEVNIWNFAPRVQAPVLMINGRYDFGFPLETNQKPLFQALGTGDADKRHVLFEGGHRNLVTSPHLIGQMLDWFDRYLVPAPPK